MEAMANERTPVQDFSVLMDMALVHISAETKQMLQQECRPYTIMIHPQTTSFLQPCDVGLVRPFKSTLRRTGCDQCAKAFCNNTDDTGSVQPTAVPAHLKSTISSSLIETVPDLPWSTTIALSLFGRTWEVMMEFRDKVLDEARQLHAAGQLFENVL